MKVKKPHPLLISLALHLILLALFATFVAQRATVTPTHKLTIIDLEPYPKDLIKKNDSEPQQRIVQTAKGVRTEKAAPDAFLGEQTQTVDRQTVSADRLIRMGKAQVTTAPKEASQPRPEKEAKAAKEMAIQPATVPLQKLGLAILPTQKKMEEMVQEKSKSPDLSEFSPPGEQAPKDYIQGMKTGEATALNTREFMFYGYYQRIRERLDRAWVPILRSNITSLYNHGRRLASEMDYSTKVMVVMNTGGEIVKVQVLNESGTEDLDSAAVSAFNKAGPFPNPPKGIVDAAGEIKIPWEFILRT